MRRLSIVGPVTIKKGLVDDSRPKPKSLVEFIILMAIMMSLVALCIDAMLPALPAIGHDLQVQKETDTQLIISVVFLGIAIGQIFYGPLSDRWGRKPATYLGFSIFITGCIISLYAQLLPMMLLGRFLQGFGLAGPRVVCMALIRDLFKGNEMARIMSFIMVVFILTPTIAPAFGQAMLYFWSWRSIFTSFLVLGIIVLIWFSLRQEETLTDANRIPFSLNRIKKAMIEVATHRIAFGYTVTSGLISGAFLGYLNLSQPIFQKQYELESRFPLIFAILAASLGVASFVNGKWVMRFGMQTMANISCLSATVVSFFYLGVTLYFEGHPPFWTLMVYLLINLFCTGILFGNLNAMAMEPLGHMAGIGAAVVGSLSTLLAVPFGVLIGRSYQGRITPLVLGFAVLAGLATLLMRWIQLKPLTEDP